MKLSAKHDAIGKVLQLLHESGAAHVLLERTGPGWVIQLMRPPGLLLERDLKAAGAVILT